MKTYKLKQTIKNNMYLLEHVETMFYVLLFLKLFFKVYDYEQEDLIANFFYQTDLF